MTENRSSPQSPDHLHVRVPPDVVEALRREALRNQRTLSGQVRWILLQALEGEEERGPEAQTLGKERSKWEV